MNKLYSCFFIFFFLLVNICYAETKDNSNLVKTNEELVAEYVLKSMQQDYTVCYVFYKIGSQSIFQSQKNDDLAKAIGSSSDISLKLAFETGELANMTIEEMKKKVNLEIEKQLIIIKNDKSNYSILLKKYSKLCKNIIQDKKSRISYWEKEAKSKFK